jgi:hypothetical protein
MLKKYAMFQVQGIEATKNTGFPALFLHALNFVCSPFLNCGSRSKKRGPADPSVNQGKAGAPLSQATDRCRCLPGPRRPEYRMSATSELPPQSLNESRREHSTLSANAALQTNWRNRFEAKEPAPKEVGGAGFWRL